MNKRFTKLIAALALLVGLTIPLGMWGQTTVTYTQSSTTAVSVTDGTAPTGSSASFTTTYSNMNQLTAGNSMTLTLYGYQGKKITGITLSMKSNSSKGAGTLSVTAGSTTIASISPAANFNTSSWYGAWSTTYVDVNIAMSNTNYTIQANEDVVITISATVNSLYCESFTFTYEDSTAPILDPCDLTLIDAPVELEFDLYNNSNAQTISYTTSSTGEVSVAQNDYINATVDQQNKTITVIPVAVTNGAKTIRVNQAPDENYASGFVEFTVDIEDSTPFSGGDVTFDAGTDMGSTTTTGPDSMTKQVVTISSTNAAFGYSDNYRMYKNSVTTVSTSSGVITSIAFTQSGNYSISYLTPDCGTLSDGTWTGSASSIVFTNDGTDQTRATKIVVTVNMSGTPDPVISASNVSIEYDATEGEITYAVENPVDDAAVVATTTAEWLTIGTIGETVPFTCSANTETSARTATVTLNYVKNGETLATKDVTVTQAAAPVVYTTIPELFDAATSTSTPVTVNFGGWVVTGVNGSQSFVTDGTNGFIMYQSSHGFVVGNTLSGTVNCNLVLFNGSAEITGLTTTTEGLTVGENGSVTPVITTIDNLAAVNTGSVVTLNTLTYDGTVLSDGNNTISPYTSLYHEASFENGKTYNITGVFVQNNSAKRILPRSAEDIEEVVVTEPSINIADATIELAAEGGEGILTVQYENITEIVAEVYFCDAEGTEATYDWITAEIDADNNVEWLVEPNEGEARTAYFKVYALDDETNDVYSNLVTVNQAAYVTPVTGNNYELFSGNLVEGDYLIVYNGKAMNNIVDNDRLQYIEVTPNNNVIVTEDAAVIWHIAPAGDYWTIYSANASAYAASTGAKNKAQMLDDGTDDKALWTVSGTETYEFVNKKNTANNVNANLRNNGTYGFACYATGTGGALSLYKRNNNYTPALAITGYGEGSGNWYLIASPVTTTPEAAGMITDELGSEATSENATYDLYYYNHNAEDGLEWRNYRTQNFELTPGTGYLYANKNNVTLTFTGTAYEGDGSFNLVSGWNLMGNPFATTAYIGRNFYMMNPAGSELIACTTSNDPIEAMHAVFVEGGDEDQVTFSTTAPDAKSQIVAINVTKNRGTAIDRAIVRFDEGQQLPKFQLNPNNTKLYIAQGDKDYAIVRSAAQGEMPVSFRAAENGTYTLSIESENVEMDYLHLIDNMTGMDVDLLQTPCYSFEAKTSDYASRFRLVFSANSIDEQSAETFAYFNGSEWMVSNLGESTLQVVDVMGRVLSTETISGNAELSLNQPAGVYMLRLINGNDVKVQKVVVR